MSFSIINNERIQIVARLGKVELQTQILLKNRFNAVLKLLEERSSQTLLPCVKEKAWKVVSENILKTLYADAITAYATQVLKRFNEHEVSLMLKKPTLHTRLKKALRTEDTPLFLKQARKIKDLDLEGKILEALHAEEADPLFSAEEMSDEEVFYSQPPTPCVAG